MNSPQRALALALVMLMLIMQAVIVAHYPVHLLEGVSHAGPSLPGKPHHHGDDACPVCFIAKSLFSLIVAFATACAAFISARFVYNPATRAHRRAPHALAFHPRGPPAFA